MKLAAGAWRDVTRAPEKQLGEANPCRIIYFGCKFAVTEVEPHDGVVGRHAGVRAETHLQVPIWP